MQNQEIQHKVIVVGAGMAGLSCAHTLHAAGVDVVVLEARDRLGGRIHSQPCQGDILDFGASWIHGIQDNPLWALSQQHQIQTTVYNYQQQQFHHPQGQVFSTSQQQFFQDYVHSIEQQLLSSQQTTALQAVQDILAHLQISDDICAEFELDAEQIKDVLMGYFKRIANDPYACELEQLTARYPKYEGYFAGDEVIFKQGYAQLIDVLARNLNIQQQAIVQDIQLRPENVQLNDQQGRRYFADQVVLSVPLGVLQQQLIQITPNLPAIHWESIQNMGFGSFNKLYFELEQPLFVQDAQHSYFFQHDQVWFEILDLSTVYDKPLYVMLFGGNQSQWIDQVTDSEVWAFVRYNLIPSLPNLPLNPKAMYVSRWGADPFSLGSFSYPQVDHHAACIETLQQPVQQQLFFAGEHCHPEYPATVHGAYLSGQATAKQILACIE